MKKQLNLILLLCLISVQTLIAQEVNKKDSNYSTFVYGVCGECKARIETAALTVEGVDSADWVIDTRILTVKIDSTFDASRLHQAINEVGHDTELSKASDDAYKALDDCCSYRDPEVLAEHGDFPEIYDIGVSGNCTMCKARIEAAAKELKTVINATYDIEKQRLYVSTTEDFKINELHQKIAAAGHDTDQLIADQVAYNNLPQCCSYRNSDTHRHMMEERGKTVSGTVYKIMDGKKIPLEYADIYTLKENNATYTDEKGHFTLELPTASAQIVVSYLGYVPDTILVSRGSVIAAHLSQNSTLKEVVVTYRRQTTGISKISTIKTYQVDDSELLKAACCNLAESFQTLPAVDVAITDAVTGTRQIKMLGLAGPNLAFSQELLPIFKGLAAIQGLTLIPGPWIAGMQINQSVGSVSNGYQGVSGQINLQLRKPQSMDPVYVNLYGSEDGRYEGNINLAHKFNKNLSTALLLHGHKRSRELDRNGDGFMDMKTGDGIGLLNRWHYSDYKSVESQLGIKYAQSNSVAGQISTLDVPKLWRANTEVEDLNVWGKLGFIFPDNMYESVAIKMSYDRFRQRSEFGDRLYVGNQDYLHVQALYQNYIGNENNELRGGLGINYRNSQEEFAALDYSIKEVIPHLFGEYTYHYKDIFSAVLGMRYDLHNLYGGFFTPRLHLKYNFAGGITLRMAAGQARRTASILAENISVMASSRTIDINGSENGLPYELPLIKTDNLAFSTIYRWNAFGNDATLSFDYFFTYFENNVIVDYDQDAHEVHIYKQKDNSRSHNVQVQWDFRPVERFDVRIAYKWQLLKLGYASGLREAPFTPNHRAFINLAYATQNDWKFDLTFNLTGPQRIPDTDELPEILQMKAESPAFLQINSQISKQIFDGFVAYLGVENLTGYQQDYAIINAKNPFSDTFDASLIWGPVSGRNVYLGIRYTIIENKSK